MGTPRWRGRARLGEAGWAEQAEVHGKTLSVCLVHYEQSSSIHSSTHPFTRQIDIELLITVCQLAVKMIPCFIHHVGKNLSLVNMKPGEQTLWVRMFSGRRIKSKPCPACVIPLWHRRRVCIGSPCQRVLPAALVVTVKKWGRYTCPPTEECIQHYGRVTERKYYAADKKNEVIREMQIKTQ